MPFISTANAVDKSAHPCAELEPVQSSNLTGVRNCYAFNESWYARGLFEVQRLNALEKLL